VAIDEAFQGLRDASHNLSREFENHVDHEFNALHQQSESLEEGLLVKGAVLLSVSFLVIVTLLWIISRSLRQLDSSIRRLGSGELAESILVEGPSDLQYLGNRLEWLRSHLLELEVSKQQFIHNVAREIEQPLVSIRESAELLIINADAGNSQQEIAQRLTETVGKLNTVSEELIRYSQINTKPDNLRKGSVDMKALLESVLEDFQSRLQAKNLSVKKLVRPVEIDGVEDQLRGIIEQLLANAVTYSPTGGEIRIMLRDSGQQMELEVEDEGQGIAPEDREHIFEPFFRGKTTQGDAGGPGLGLAIVREYVANHQGKAEIIDPREDQQGARFRVQIPLTGDV
jgi:two-component system sensor histidine kinase GlrK